MIFFSTFEPEQNLSSARNAFQGCVEIPEDRILDKGKNGRFLLKNGNIGGMGKE
jgi:hypothetical protein